MSLTQYLVQLVQSRLTDWFVALHHLRHAHPALRNAIREAGTRLLFSAEGIRIILDISPSSKPVQKPEASTNLLDALSSILSSNPRTSSATPTSLLDQLDPLNAVLSEIPPLFESFIAAIKRDAANLASVPGLGATESGRVKAAAMSFVAQCLNGPLSIASPENRAPRDVSLLQARASLLRVLDRHSDIHDLGDVKGLGVLQAELELALSVLSTGELSNT